MYVYSAIVLSDQLSVEMFTVYSQWCNLQKINEVTWLPINHKTIKSFSYICTYVLLAVLYGLAVIACGMDCFTLFKLVQSWNFNLR